MKIQILILILMVPVFTPTAHAGSTMEELGYKDGTVVGYNGQFFEIRMYDRSNPPIDDFDFCSIDMNMMTLFCYKYFEVEDLTFQLNSSTLETDNVSIFIDGGLMYGQQALLFVYDTLVINGSRTDSNSIVNSTLSYGFNRNRTDDFSTIQREKPSYHDPNNFFRHSYSMWSQYHNRHLDFNMTLSFDGNHTGVEYNIHYELITEFRAGSLVPYTPQPEGDYVEEDEYDRDMNRLFLWILIMFIIFGGGASSSKK